MGKEFEKEMCVYVCVCINNYHCTVHLKLTKHC